MTSAMRILDGIPAHRTCGELVSAPSRQQTAPSSRALSSGRRCTLSRRQCPQTPKDLLLMLAPQRRNQLVPGATFFPVIVFFHGGGFAVCPQ
ncbi:hypothetical protein BDV10DRAFT_36521 [Aspergillus recurvatus]